MLTVLFCRATPTVPIFSYMCIMEELGFITGHDVEYTVAPDSLPEGQEEERIVSVPAPDDVGADKQRLEPAGASV